MLKSNSIPDKNTNQNTNIYTHTHANANDPKISNTKENPKSYMNENHIDNIYYNSPVNKKQKDSSDNNEIDYPGNDDYIDTINRNDINKTRTPIKIVEEDKLDVNEIKVYFSNNEKIKC